MDEISIHIGKKIKQLREAKKISQQELGKLLSYSSMAISHFENGAREIKNADLRRIAEFFNVEFSSFFPAETTFFRADKNAGTEAANSLKNFDDFLDKDKLNE